MKINIIPPKEQRDAGRITWIAGPDDMECERIVEFPRERVGAASEDLVDAIEGGEHWQPGA